MPRRIYVAAVEPLTYLLGLLFADQTVVPIGDDGLPFAWLRYGGWLCTCPVLLLNLTNLPKGRKYKSPMNTLGALVLDQVMIVAGVSAIFYKGIAKAALFAIGLLAGAALFRIAFNTFQSASKSYPEHARTWLWGIAVVFFSSWCLFPILWLLGPEGSGVISVQDSLVMHAIADLVSKNTYSGMAWWLKWVVLDTKPLAFARKNNETKQSIKGSKSSSNGDSTSGSKTGRKSSRSRSRDRADRSKQLAIEAYDQRSLPASEDDDYMGDETTGEFAYLEDFDSSEAMSERGAGGAGFDDPFAQRQAMALIESILNGVRDFDRKHALSIALVTRSVPDAKQVVEGVDHASRGTASVSVQADLLGYAKMVWTGQDKACGHIVLVSPEVLEWLAVATEAEMSASGVVQHTKKGSRIGNGTAQAPAADMSQVYLHAIDEDRSLPSFEDRRIPAWEDGDTAAKVRDRLVGVFGSRPVVCLLGGEADDGGASSGKDNNNSSSSDRRGRRGTAGEGPQPGDRQSRGRGRVTRADAMLCGCVDVVRSSDEQDGLRALLRSAQQHIAGCVFEVAEGRLRASLQRQLLAFRQGGAPLGGSNGFMTAGGASDSIASRAFADDQSRAEMGLLAGRPAIADAGLGAAPSSWLGGGAAGVPGAKADGGVRVADWTRSPTDTTGPGGFAAGGLRDGKGSGNMGGGQWNQPIYSDSDDDGLVQSRTPFSMTVGVMGRNDDASGVGSGAKRQVLDRLRGAQDALRQQEQLQQQEQLRSTPRGGVGVVGGEESASDIDESPVKNMRRGDDDDDDEDEADGIGDVLVQGDEDEDEESKSRGEDEYAQLRGGSGIQRGGSSRSRSSRRGGAGNRNGRRGRSVSTRGRREQQQQPGSRMLPGSDDEDERDRSRRRSRTPQPLQRTGMGSGLKSGRKSRRGSITSLRGGRRGPAGLETSSSSRRGLVQGSPRVARSVMGDVTRSRMLGGSDSQSVF